ncbi:inorganic pyrophosphatase [Brachionus plicatilis]|uniref:inorganic diphosphatase n=1 Tax=Brachionus plicatilis TaxID=10195 RepID=A0A3M7PMS2_BRAPC|nr:inorganic pyrophosphatase [Brachionus plicatilis]
MNLSVEYEPEFFGTQGSDTFRIFFKKILPNVVDQEFAKVFISPFHDIPLYSEIAPNIHRMVVRMPRWTNARMEINKKEPFNPIKQDSSHQVLRYFDNIFPFHGVLWNYGSFPQTWEMQSSENPDFPNLKNDNNLLDVIEIGSKVHKTGAVIDVKILGAFVLIEQDHLDWKIIAIDINDKLSSKLDTIKDIDEYMPGLLDSTLEFFKYYKIVLGCPPIFFGYANPFLGKNEALAIIEKSHKSWNKLIKNETYFKNSKDSVDFKLFNTQCLESNKENLRNSKEAEALVENLKSLIINRPIESMAEQPQIERIEKVIYLNKKDILNKTELLRGQITEKGQNSNNMIVRSQKLGEYLVENFWIMSGTLSVITLGILISIKKFKH